MSIIVYHIGGEDGWPCSTHNDDECEECEDVGAEIYSTRAPSKNVGAHADQAYILTSVWISGVGDIVRMVHSPDRCAGEHCVIHNPSDHIMKDFPTHWRPANEPFGRGYGFMERMCPHGIGHPDPDDAAYLSKLPWITAHGTHGCDGCCRGEGPA